MISRKNITLLEKYELRIDYLDYKYIETCNDVKTLQKILHVLRSGEEGSYPHLTSFCEERLQKLNPEIKSFSKCSNSVIKNAQKDMEMWALQVTTLEKEWLKPEHSLPPIRKMAVIQSKTSHRLLEEEKRKNKRLVPRSYEEWNKFDVEQELTKLSDDEENEISSETKNDPEEDEFSGLSGSERLFYSNVERQKGDEEFKVQNYQEASFYYQRSLLCFAETQTLYKLIDVYVMLKDNASAKRHCDVLLAENPNDIKGLESRGKILKQEGKLESALADFKRLLQLDSKNSVIRKEVETIHKEQSEKGSHLLIEEVNNTPLPDISENNIIEVSEKINLTEINYPKTEPSIDKKSNLTLYRKPSLSENAKTEISAFDFLQEWNRLKASHNACAGASCLEAVQPKALPRLLSNQLDGDFLSAILSAIHQLAKTGKHEKGTAYLDELIKVPRITTVAMLLSKDEKQVAKDLLSFLEKKGTDTQVYRKVLLKK